MTSRTAANVKLQEIPPPSLPANVEAKRGKVTAPDSARLPTLPNEMIGIIASFAGFREVNILDCLIPEVCLKQDLREIGSPSLESAVDRGRVYEVQYRLRKNPQPKFRRTILMARAIRMQRWRIVGCLVTVFKTQPNLWDVFEGVKNGIDSKTLQIVFETYPEPQLEKMRPACLLQSELQNNPDVFLFMLKACDDQKRRRGQIRKIISYIEERRWQRLLAR